MNSEIFKGKIEKNWLEKLKPHIESQEFDSIINQIKEDSKKYKIIPDSNNLFNAFLVPPYDDIKVVILGQDPYYNFINNKPIAEGLAFSSANLFHCPPSLRNILKEVERDIYNGLNLNTTLDFSLRRWACQGILLLNTSLTVKKDLPRSHIKIWKNFIKNIFNILNNHENKLIFMLWGREAQKYKELINTNLHYIIEAGHPSGLNTKNPFIGNGCFSKCNKLLIEQKKEEILW